MTRRRPRGLTADERDLWRKVTRQDAPLHPERPPPIAEQVGQRAAPPPPADIPPFRIGERAAETAMPPAAVDGAAGVRMDRKSFGQMKRGKLQPEARIDLHGMSLAQAHPALNRFILDSHAQGRRLVLVITGKGKRAADDGPIPARRGLLRHQVPHWLGAPPLAQLVLQVTEAHRRHGGGGAYYVYLRRKR